MTEILGFTHQQIFCFIEQMLQILNVWFNNAL